MAWNPHDIPVDLERNATFSLSDLEDSAYPTCPARAGIKARKGRVSGQPQQEPFDNLLTAMIKEVVVALSEGRHHDSDGGLARAAATYQQRHPIIREFLDAAALNYLEFLESRELEVGTLTYIGHSFRRDLAANIGLKLWAPVYKTERGVREIHRLRYSRADSATGTWAIGAAWIAGHRAPGSTVVEFGLSDGSAAIIYDESRSDEIQSAMRSSLVPTLRDLFASSHQIPGSNCVGCDAVGVCPALIPLNILDGLADATAWVRSVSESHLSRYRICPASALAMSLHLPREPSTSDAMQRGERVHRWIAQRHAENVPCDRALFEQGTGFEDDEPYLEAHAALCNRGNSTTISLEQTMVGWDAALADVVFMKPDEIALRDGTLVLREIKTTTSSATLDPAVAWEQYADASAWWLAALEGGLAIHFGATSAVLELEVLTPEGGAVHRLSTIDHAAKFRVAGWRLDTPAIWLGDRQFNAKPGPQCSQCEFIRWCKEGRAQA